MKIELRRRHLDLKGLRARMNLPAEESCVFLLQIVTVHRQTFSQGRGAIPKSQNRVVFVFQIPWYLATREQPSSLNVCQGNFIIARDGSH